MSCQSLREKLTAYAEGDPPLGAAGRAELERHLAGCPACRAELEALREQIELLRGAGAWARRRGAEIKLSLPERTRRGRRRASRSPLAWAAAAAAALLLAALGAWGLLGGANGRRPAGEEPPGHLLAGAVLESGEPVGLLAAGGRYLVPAGRDAEIALRGGAKVELAGGSSFQVPEDFAAGPGLKLLAGELRCESNAPMQINAERISARACGRFALATSEGAPPPPGRAAARWGDWLFPPAFAAEPDPAAPRRAPEAFLLSYGWAELAVNGTRVRLSGRRALVGGDGREAAWDEPERLLAGMSSERERLLENLLTPRYRAMVAEYLARRAGYVKRLAAPELTREEKDDLGWRIAMMEELSRAHAERLKALAPQEAGRLGGAERLLPRIEVLRRLLDGNGRPEGKSPQARPEDADGPTGTFPDGRKPDLES